MIFIDLRVGDDQGFATLQRLRATARTRHLPVIILSNQEPGEMARRGFEANALDYVVRADPGPNSLASNLEVWARAGSGRSAPRRSGDPLALFDGRRRVRR